MMTRDEAIDFLNEIKSVKERLMVARRDDSHAADLASACGILTEAIVALTFVVKDKAYEQAMREHH